MKMKQFYAIFLSTFFILTYAGNFPPLPKDLFEIKKKPIETSRTSEILLLYPNDCKCRLKAASRIVGGKVAEENKVPWAVSISHHGYHVCGGNIINHNYILTSATCATQILDKIKVRIGIHKLDDPLIAKKTYDVEKIFQITDTNSQDGDIGILKLAKQIEFVVGKVEPACLNFEKTIYTNEMMACGWGAVTRAYQSIYDHSDFQIGQASPVLKYAYFNETDLSGNVQGCNSDNMICIDSDKKDGVCFADTGSPIHYDHNGKTAVEGVSSTAYFDGQTGEHLFIVLERRVILEYPLTKNGFKISSDTIIVICKSAIYNLE